MKSSKLLSNFFTEDLENRTSDLRENINKGQIGQKLQLIRINVNTSANNIKLKSTDDYPSRQERKRKLENVNLVFSFCGKLKVLVKKDASTEDN